MKRHQHLSTDPTGPNKELTDQGARLLRDLHFQCLDCCQDLQGNRCVRVSMHGRDRPQSARAARPIPTHLLQLSHGNFAAVGWLVVILALMFVILSDAAAKQKLKQLCRASRQRRKRKQKHNTSMCASQAS